MQTSFEDFTVFFAVLIFFRVERNWSLAARHVVTGLWACSPIAECVSKEIFLVVTTAGGAAIPARGGRAVLWKSKTYDYTKGFQGEDVLLLQLFTSCE